MLSASEFCANSEFYIAQRRRSTKGREKLNLFWFFWNTALGGLVGSLYHDVEDCTDQVARNIICVTKKSKNRNVWKGRYSQLQSGIVGRSQRVGTLPSSQKQTCIRNKNKSRNMFEWICSHLVSEKANWVCWVGVGRWMIALGYNDWQHGYGPTQLIQIDTYGEGEQ